MLLNGWKILFVNDCCFVKLYEQWQMKVWKFCLLKTFLEGAVAYVPVVSISHYIQVATGTTGFDSNPWAFPDPSPSLSPPYFLSLFTVLSQWNKPQNKRTNKRFDLLCFSHLYSVSECEGPLFRTSGCSLRDIAYWEMGGLLQTQYAQDRVVCFFRPHIYFLIHPNLYFKCFVYVLQLILFCVFCTFGDF